MRSFASLRRTADFSRLRQRGRRTATANLTVYRADAAPKDERPLVGITVSKSVGTAVIRNRLRRRLAASLHDLLSSQARMRLLVIARPSAAALPFAALQDELRRALG
jgi:ribonuclease P protein component